MSKPVKIPKVPPAAIRAYGEMLEYRLMVVAAVAARVLSRSGPPAPPFALASPTRDEVDAGRVIVRGAIALAFGLPWPWPPVAAQEPVAEQPQVLAALNVTAAVGQAVTSK